MQPYLGPPWTDSHPIWAVDVFHHDHALPIHGIQDADLKEKKIVISSILYSIRNIEIWQFFLKIR